MKFIKPILILSFLILTWVGCSSKEIHPNIEIDIENLPENISEAHILSDQGQKTIQLKNGIFKDTIHAKTGYGILQIGEFGKMIYIDNNTELKITADALDFNHSIEYSGSGAKENSYLHQRELLTIELIQKIDSLNLLHKNDFLKEINHLHDQLDHLLTDDLSPKLLVTEKEQLDIFLQNIEQQYNAVNQINTGISRGDASPKFEAYENYQGGTTSLSDLRGSFVYIDIWATWCPPCRAQIPYLKDLEKRYHKQNIKFLSISIDSPSAKNQWKDMIKDKEMGGIQLFANGDESFVKAYQVQGIPRFILLDPKGNIVLADAPRPSDPETITLLDQTLH